MDYTWSIVCNIILECTLKNGILIIKPLNIYLMLNLKKLNMEMSSVIVFAILGVTNIVGVESIGL